MFVPIKPIMIVCAPHKALQIELKAKPISLVQCIPNPLPPVDRTRCGVRWVVMIEAEPGTKASTGPSIFRKK